MDFLIEAEIGALTTATGAGLFMLGIGLLIEKVKTESEKSYFSHYFSSILLLIMGGILFFIGYSLKN